LPAPGRVCRRPPGRRQARTAVRDGLAEASAGGCLRFLWISPATRVYHVLLDSSFFRCRWSNGCNVRPPPSVRLTWSGFPARMPSRQNDHQVLVEDSTATVIRAVEVRQPPFTKTRRGLVRRMPGRIGSGSRRYSGSAGVGGAGPRLDLPRSWFRKAPRRLIRTSQRGFMDYCELCRRNGS